MWFLRSDCPVGGFPLPCAFLREERSTRDRKLKRWLALLKYAAMQKFCKRICPDLGDLRSRADWVMWTKKVSIGFWQKLDIGRSDENG